MRRKDKEITRVDLITAILHSAEAGYLALSCDNIPYCIPVNFAYRDGFLYIHSALEGEKLKIIRKNNMVCFQADVLTHLVRGEDACSFGMKYASANCLGEAEILEDPAEKNEALRIIADKYTDRKETDFPPKALSAVSCIRVRVTRTTGKLSGYSPEEALGKINPG